MSAIHVWIHGIMLIYGYCATCKAISQIVEFGVLYHFIPPGAVIPYLATECQQGVIYASFKLWSIRLFVSGLSGAAHSRHLLCSPQPRVATGCGVVPVLPARWDHLGAAQPCRSPALQRARTTLQAGSRAGNCNALSLKPTSWLWIANTYTRTCMGYFCSVSVLIIFML